MSKELSHIDGSGKAAMVNVGHKPATLRRAVAACVVEVPSVVLEKLSEGELVSAKGPVFQTAILAGIMGAKKTGELIPLCHPMGLDHCAVRIGVDGNTITIECEAQVTGKTGVEMEALTGASIAALTIYDMCKALSHDITISKLRLVEKSGGKNDFRR
ncbi:MAG: cyclic pyranopterin monophosphate synthase MoaC [Flavobacteriales bacterium]|nr:cyclic pyranopterin monophosphate synthase MoaC [Flavobacteriales bacterium]